MAAQSKYSDTVFPPPLVEGNHTFGSVTETICSVVESKPNLSWLMAFLLAIHVKLLMLGSIAYLFWEGTGIKGLNPVGWGWAIVNFVFWVGIGHANLDQCDSLPVPTEVENGHQSLCRGDDHLRGYLRPCVPWDSRGSCLGCILDAPAP